MILKAYRKKIEKSERPGICTEERSFEGFLRRRKRLSVVLRELRRSGVFWFLLQPLTLRPLHVILL
jgi:hypothetical protein